MQPPRPSGVPIAASRAAARMELTGQRLAREPQHSLAGHLDRRPPTRHGYLSMIILKMIMVTCKPDVRPERGLPQRSGGGLGYLSGTAAGKARGFRYLSGTAAGRARGFRYLSGTAAGRARGFRYLSGTAAGRARGFRYLSGTAAGR